MKLRIVSAALWFLAGWAVGATLTTVLGLSQALDPLIGVAWAAIVLADPRHLLWHSGARSSVPVTGLDSNGAAAQ